MARPKKGHVPHYLVNVRFNNNSTDYTYVSTDPRVQFVNQVIVKSPMTDLTVVRVTSVRKLAIKPNGHKYVYGVVDKTSDVDRNELLLKITELKNQLKVKIESMYDEVVKMVAKTDKDIAKRLREIKKLEGQL